MNKPHKHTFKFGGDVRQYLPGEYTISLQSDLAGHDPVYVFLSPDKSYALHSSDLVALLEHPLIPKPLQPSRDAVSFLLQSGVIPPPLSAYEGFYILGIGHTAQLKTRDGGVELEFSYEFPFFTAKSKPHTPVTPDKQLLLKHLAEAVEQKLEPGRPGYLFHSAGKDSNMIALALSKTDLRQSITLVTYRSSKDESDESEISRQIAGKLGFRHVTLEMSKAQIPQLAESFRQFHKYAPFPCMDKATLAYPVYSNQMDFQSSNIVDGMGNDVYIGHVPPRSEFRDQRYMVKVDWMGQWLDSMNKGMARHPLSKTRADWTGLSGFNAKTTAMLLEGAQDVSVYWKKFSRGLNAADYFDFRAAVRGGTIDQEKFMRKVRNFADVNRSNVIFPWADTAVVEYFKGIPRSVLFDPQKFRNKLLLREILKEEIGLDSDALGKKSYSFDVWEVLNGIRSQVVDEILSCKLWQPKHLENLLSDLFRQAQAGKRTGANAQTLLTRLYQVSLWFNHCKYLSS